MKTSSPRNKRTKKQAPKKQAPDNAQKQPGAYLWRQPEHNKSIDHQHKQECQRAEQEKEIVTERYGNNTQQLEKVNDGVGFVSFEHCFELPGENDMLASKLELEMNFDDALSSAVIDKLSCTQVNCGNVQGGAKVTTDLESMHETSWPEEYNNLIDDLVSHSKLEDFASAGASHQAPTLCEPATAGKSTEMHF